MLLTNSLGQFTGLQISECGLKRFLPVAHQAAGDRAVLHPSSLLKEGPTATGTSEQHAESWLLQGPAEIRAFSPTSQVPHKHSAAMLAACSSKFFQAVAWL